MKQQNDPKKKGKFLEIMKTWMLKGLIAHATRYDIT